MPLLSISQIAASIGKSRQWVWFQIRTGQLKAEKVGNQYVIDAEDLNEITKSNQSIGDMSDEKSQSN